MSEPKLTPKLSRAARALCGWRLSDLAEHSGVPQSTLTQFEGKGEGSRLTTLNNRACIAAFESAGVVLVMDGVEPGEGDGVRFKRK